MSLADKLAELKRLREAKAACAPAPSAAPQALKIDINKQSEEIPKAATLSFQAPDFTGLEAIAGLDLKEFSVNYGELEIAIAGRAPGLKNYLEKINDQLNKYPELLHKLKPEQLKLIVSGFLEESSIVIQDYIKSPKSSKQRTASILEKGFELNLD